jgi:hypothetical protein
VSRLQRPRFAAAAAACSLSLAIALAAPPASAQSATDSATAESLFNEALELLANKRAAEACPKLEVSQRLDPGIGTLLYLADCYQQTGRTASAWGTFREAAYLAKAAKDDREDVAVESARNLEPKLSYLLVQVTPSAGSALEVERDGTVMQDALWNTAIPVDPGAHTVKASAPGKKPWSTTVNVGEGPRQETVVVPALEDAPVAMPVAAVPMSAPPAEPTHAANTQKTVGWVLLGAGSAGLITGGVLALLARGDNTDAKSECRPDVIRLCNPRGVELGNSAHTKATWAGVSAGVGIAALGAGVTLLLLAPASSPQANASRVSLAARLDSDGGQLSLSHAW